ncbi:tRNA (cytidine(34)-2'-O)-methyltransferase [Prochlorococcus sp. MIT 1300]|uniref:tRNA (cytidine(34)-2'-O)-methyltransferase n=1 Tax=Prochlorococcus sp. MIT 1300 TaxID=3096218 RepID=UPI002A763E78|nr:tRNA (cytidine(34)-2'-O)-methyltransferase [Prochlorococcus sp. MIT 1300]
MDPLSIVLHEPQIPPNTGNIARTCAAFRLPLHLIRPLGFSLDDKYLKRAGLDYWHLVNVMVHENISTFERTLNSNQRVLGTSKFGGLSLNEVKFTKGDVLLFGREDTGIPPVLRKRCDLIISIPMPGSIDDLGKSGVRSLNLSVACALVAYQACTQLELINN